MGILIWYFRNQRKVNASFVAFLLLFSGFTVFEYVTEPPSWKPQPGDYSYLNRVPVSPPGIISFYNFTSDGAFISIGYHYGLGSLVNNFTGLTGTGIQFTFIYWLQSEYLIFPYTGFSLIFDSLTLSVNGTLFKNITNFDRSNILPYFYYYGPPLPYDKFQGLASFFFGKAQGNYGQTPWYVSLNNGTYAFNFTLEVTPVLEIGPYHMNLAKKTFRYDWVATYIA
ncbi:MAG: hypothetical protein ACYDAZ_01475 [Thermoplasmataceae archaeon]